MHACWYLPGLERLARKDDAWYLPDQRWNHAARPGEPEYEAIDVLTKGPEIELPGGATIIDKDGHTRNAARLKWWEPHPGTLGQALLFQSRPEGVNLDAPFPGESYPGYPRDDPPVFFGHYWNSGPIAPERPNAVCLDYSAGMGDRLVAYRLGGEERLDPERFVARKVVAPRPADRMSLSTVLKALYGLTTARPERDR